MGKKARKLTAERVARLRRALLPVESSGCSYVENERPKVEPKRTANMGSKSA